MDGGGRINESAGKVVQQCHTDRKFQSPPNDKLPFPLEFSNHIRYYKTIGLVVGLKGREKVWWYLYPFRYNTGVWHPARHITTAIAALMHSVTRAKRRQVNASMMALHMSSQRTVPTEYWTFSNSVDWWTIPMPIVFYRKDRDVEKLQIRAVASVCLSNRIINNVPVGSKTRSSADADKPARRVYRSVKVTKHNTIPYARYCFILCNSNFVFKTRRFCDILDFKKCRDLEIGVRGHSRSLKVAPFDWLCMVSY